MKQKIFASFFTLNFLFILSAVAGFFISQNPVLAYLPLTQTDWSGGTTGKTTWVDSKHFQTSYNIKYATPGLLTIGEKPTNWLDNSWEYRQKISFNNQEGGDVQHFPALIKLEHLVNFDYSHVQPNGFDLRFTDSDGTTLLDYEIERWNQTGTSYIWVKVPTIDGSSDTDFIYMYYGNPSAEHLEHGGTVWDKNFVMVHHLGDQPKPGHKYTDSADTNNDGTLTDAAKLADTTQDGYIGKALKFPGVGTEWVQIPNTSTTEFGTSTDFTMEGWVNMDADYNNARIIEKREGGVLAGYSLHYNGSAGGFRILVDPIATIGFCIADGTFDPQGTGWHYVVGVVYRRSTCTADDLKLYVDGKLTDYTASGAASNSDISTSASTNLYLGAFGGATPGTQYKGILDEVRLSNKARDDTWINATYRTVTGTMQSYGHEETRDAYLVSSVYDAGKGSRWGYLSYVADILSHTSVEVTARSAKDPTMAGAADFKDCLPISNQQSILHSKCVFAGDRYLQYQLTLKTDTIGKSPTLDSLSITDYLPQLVKPVVKGVSTIAPSPSPDSLFIIPHSTPIPAPRPSPSLTTNHYPLITPILNFLDALFH